MHHSRLHSCIAALMSPSATASCKVSYSSSQAPFPVLELKQLRLW